MSTINSKSTKQNETSRNSRPEKLPNVKIVVVGDGIVGKTCLLSSYVNNIFPQDYVPTVFEQFGKTITVDGIAYEMTLWDTAGQEDYERLRPLSYSNTSCFVVCFSVDKTLASYKNVESKWAPEVRHYGPTAPIVLVSTKIDLREDPSVPTYKYEDGVKMKKKIKARKYLETSALRMEGLDEIFIEAIREVQKSKMKRRTRECKII